MVKAIILDVDGTLMDTNYQHVEAWAQALQAVGRPAPRSAIHRQIGKGADQFIPEFVDDGAAGQRADQVHGDRYAQLSESAYPLPGATELIASLAERGCAVWLATSAKPEELERSLQALQADGRLAGIVSSGDVEESKPAPDIFELALEKAGCRPEDAVVVGDTAWDIQAADAAGLRTVAVLTGGAFSQAELEDAGAIAVYRDCAALLASGFPEGL